MLKTVILSPYCKYASGTMEQTSDAHSIKLRLNLDCRDCNEDDIIRLYALSTAHAAMQPYLVQSFEGNFLSPLESVIYESDIFSLGYKLWEIDTYVITKFTKDTETAVAAAFFGLEWSASRFLKDKGEITDVDSDSPLKRAKQILDNRKNTNQKENCMMQSVVLAELKQKFHLSQAKEKKFFVKSALQKEMKVKKAG